MTATDTANKLGLLQRTSQRLFRSSNLGYAHAISLLAVSPTRPGVLSSELGVSTAAITGLLDVLERRGLVNRTTTSDRRGYNITLTPKGEEVAVAIASALAGTDPRDLRTLPPLALA